MRKIYKKIGSFEFYEGFKLTREAYEDVNQKNIPKWFTRAVNCGLIEKFPIDKGDNSFGKHHQFCFAINKDTDFTIFWDSFVARKMGNKGDSEISFYESDFFNDNFYSVEGLKDVLTSYEEKMFFSFLRQAKPALKKFGVEKLSKCNLKTLLQEDLCQAFINLRLKRENLQKELKEAEKVGRELLRFKKIFQKFVEEVEDE